MRHEFLSKTGVTLLWSAATAAAAFGQVAGNNLTHQTEPYRLTARQQKLDGNVRAARKADGNPATRLVRADGRVNVSIRFDHELTDAEMALYEDNGVSFRRLPSGRVAGAAGIYAAWASSDALDMLADDPTVISIEGGRPLQTRAPMDLSRVEVQADLRHATRTWSDFQGNRGRGVTIGVVDTGIDIFHPDFFKLKSIAPYNWIDVDGNGGFTPGVDAVDMNRNGQAEANEKLNFVERLADADSSFNVYDCDTDWLYRDNNNNGTRDYGTAAGFSESDDCYGEALFLTNDTNGDDRLSPGETLQPLGQSKVRKVLFGDHEYVRGVDLIDTPIDTNGHGTSVASVLVAQASGYNRRFCGVAPEAELVMVDRYSFEADSAAERQDNYVEMLLWMEDCGSEVMLWEFGGWTSQFLDGSSHLEALISNRQFIGYSAQVTPNGNLGGSNRHAQVDVTPGERGTRTLDIPSGLGATGVFATVLTHATSGTTNMLVEIKNSTSGYALLPGNGLAQMDGHNIFCKFSISSRGTHRFDLTIMDEDGATIDADDWTIRVRNSGSNLETYHFYVSDNATSWSGGTTWTNPVDAYLTTWPATADVCIGAASYSTKAGDFTGDVPGVLSPFSSPGPRVDGTPIQGVAAPGDYGDVLCAQSQAINSAGAWGGVRGFGGTSAAGPHVAGAAALLFEAVPAGNAMDVRDALFASALQDGFTGAVPNDRWGWGKLQADDAYYALADARCQEIVPPALDLPFNGQGDFDPSVSLELSWDAAQNANLYDLHFGTSNPPALYVPGLTGTQMNVLASRLEANTTYYWQVVAFNSCGYVSKSEVRTVTTGEAYVPTPDLQIYQQVLVDNEFIREHIPSGDTYGYPAVQVGSQHGIIFALYNEGDASLNLTGSPKIQLAGPGAAHFVVNYTPNENSIAADNWAPIAIRFKPESVGSQICQVRVETNDEDGVYTFFINGLGLPGDDNGDGGSDDGGSDDGGSDDGGDDDGDDDNTGGDDGAADPNEPGDDDAGDDGDDAGDETGDDDGDDTGDEDDNVIDDPNTPAGEGDVIDDPNTPTNDDGDVNGETPGDGNGIDDQDDDNGEGDDQNEQDIDDEIDGGDLEDDLLDVAPILPGGFCGFGAGFAFLTCSLAYAGRGTRRRFRR